MLSPSELVDPESEEYHGTWALVDINKLVKRPADMLCDPTSTFFLVMASSPTASRMRQLQKYRRPADYWLMKPFTLGELIQASVFLASISSFVHSCDIPGVNYKRLFSKNQLLKTSLRSTGRQLGIVTSMAKPVSDHTKRGFAPRSKK